MLDPVSYWFSKWNIPKFQFQVISLVEIKVQERYEENLNLRLFMKQDRVQCKWHFENGHSISFNLVMVEVRNKSRKLRCILSLFYFYLINLILFYLIIIIFVYLVKVIEDNTKCNIKSINQTLFPCIQQFNWRVITKLLIPELINSRQ